MMRFHKNSPGHCPLLVKMRPFPGASADIRLTRDQWVSSSKMPSIPYDDPSCAKVTLDEKEKHWKKGKKKRSRTYFATAKNHIVLSSSSRRIKYGFMFS